MRIRFNVWVGEDTRPTTFTPSELEEWFRDRTEEEREDFCAQITSNNEDLTLVLMNSNPEDATGACIEIGMLIDQISV
jgi:hypothetical protein